MSFYPNNLDHLIQNFYIFGVELEEIEISSVENNYSKKDFLQIKLLSKFPPIKSENFQIVDPNVIISHCFPNGFILKTSEKNIDEREYFFFNLRNFYRISSEDKILYFTCCIFYENLTEYISIKNEQKNQKNEIKNKNIYIPKLLCINSFYQFPNQFQLILDKLISYSKSKDIKIPIEKIIENLILGIPSPKKLIFYPSLKNSVLPETKIDFTLSDMNKVRFYSYKMQMIYEFNLDEILEIYKWILLEQPVLFFSENKEKLTNIFETFLLLIFPFVYQGAHCSILPECNAGIIEQEEYFIFGINEKWDNSDNKNNYFERLNINLFRAVLICDIDNKKVFSYRQHKNFIEIYNDFRANKNFNIKIISSPTNDINPISKGEKCKLPQKYSEKLKIRIGKTSKHKSNNEYNKEINQKISDNFFYFLVSILKNYNQYLFNSENDIIVINDLFLKENIKKINIEKLFDSGQFIKKEIEKNDDPYFFQNFFKTDLFKNFMFRKYQNLEEDKYTFLLFDETIVMKKNKNELIKVKTKFLDSKNFSTNNIYVCNKETEFQKEEIEQINLKKDELINYYQKYENNNFSYYLFPKLLNDGNFLKVKNYFENQYDEEQLREFYQKDKNNLKEIEDKEYFKIYEGGLIEKYNFDTNEFVIKNETKNFVGYLWISIFCFTFFYCDNDDKEYRFQELFINLQKLDYTLLSQNNLIYHLFMSLINYGSDSMIIKFYDYLTNSNYNNYDLYNIFCNRMKSKTEENEEGKNNLILKNIYVGTSDISFNYYKDKNEEEIKLKNSLIKSENNKNNKIPFISKRTFDTIEKGNKYKNNNDKVKEEIEDIEFGCVKCPFCEEEVNFTKLLKNNSSKRKELSCNNCKKFFKPKCKVKVGSFNTDFLIFHPYYLYNNIYLDLLKKYGTKIDLEILKDEYSDFYWGCILYFSFCGYSFDMLIKYKKENEKK